VIHRQGCSAGRLRLRRAGEEAGGYGNNLLLVKAQDGAAACTTLPARAGRRAASSPDRAAWETYVQDFAARVAHPLTITGEREANEGRVSLLIALLAFVAVRRGWPVTDIFKDWPAGTDPREVGPSASPSAFIHDAAHGDAVRTEPQVVALRACRDLDRRAAVRRGDEGTTTCASAGGALRSLHTGNRPARPRTDHVDGAVFWPAARSSSTCRSTNTAIARSASPSPKAQWDNPLPDGSDQPDALVDRRTLHDQPRCSCRRIASPAMRSNLERSAREMVAYLQKLQQPNGLFFHAPDVKILLGVAEMGGVGNRHGRDAAGAAGEAQTAQSP